MQVMMHQLAYISSTQTSVSRYQLSDILKVSRRNNERDGITGLLIYHDKLFFQLLEGPQNAVEDCFHRICKDARHGQAAPVFVRNVETRSYPDWTMGLIKPLDMAPEARSAIRGLHFIQESDAVPTQDPAITTLVRDVLGEMQRPRSS